MQVELPSDQRFAYLVGLGKVLSMGSQEVTSTVLPLAGAGMGLSPTQIEDVVRAVHEANSVQEALTGLTDPIAGRMLVQQLILLANADRDYDAAERAGVRVVADVLGFASEFVSQMEMWVAEGLAWQDRGRELVQAGRLA